MVFVMQISHCALSQLAVLVKSLMIHMTTLLQRIAALEQNRAALFQLVESAELHNAGVLC